MFYTNEELAFADVVEQRLKTCTAADIAVGYCGFDMIKRFGPALRKAAAKGRVRLILGMYRIQGTLSGKLHAELLALHEQLQRAAEDRNDGTGVYITQVDYHGKIYRFMQGMSRTVWVGSCNFSDAGLKGNLESCVMVPAADQQAVEDYVDRLADPKCSVTIDCFDCRPPSRTLGNAVTALPAGALPVGSLDIVLRVDQQPNSSLNLCFEEGRKQNGVYMPRPWYEVEITVDKETRENPLYPKCTAPVITSTKNGKPKKILKNEFSAYLSDGIRYWPCRLATYSDHSKALASTPERHTLGEFIKGQLEKAGVLARGNRITSAVLAQYGRDFVTLTKLSNGEYVLTF